MIKTRDNEKVKHKGNNKNHQKQFQKTAPPTASSGSKGKPKLPRYIMGGTILAPVGLVATETSAVFVHPESSKQQASKKAFYIFYFDSNVCFGFNDFS